MLEGSWDIKFVILVENFNTDCPSSITVKKEFLFAFNSDLAWATNRGVKGGGWGGGWGEAGNIVLLFFCLGVLCLLVSEGWWGRAATPIHIFVPGVT